MTTDGEEKKKTVSEVAVALLCYTRKARSTVSSNFSLKTRHASVCKQTVRVWRKESSYENLQSHVNYERHGKDPTMHPR